MDLSWRMRSGLTSPRPYIVMGSADGLVVKNLDEATEFLKRKFYLPYGADLNWTKHSGRGGTMYTLLIPFDENSRWEVQLVARDSEG